MSQLVLFTNKIPHHAAHSGYEQLVHYVSADETLVRRRHVNQTMWQRGMARALRGLAASRWYMWDGLEAEYQLFRHASRSKELTVVHYLYGDTSLGLLPYLKSAMNLKLMLSVHACPGDLGEIMHNPKLLHRVDKFILLGNNQKKFFLDHGIAPEKLEVVYHGVDTNYFTPLNKKRKAEKRTARRFKLLIVGNWKRNFEFYRQVLSQLNRESLYIDVNVITASHNSKEFEHLSNVNVQHEVSDSQLLELYQTSDVLLMGLKDSVANNVVLEAMACGLPVVTEEVGAIREYMGNDGIFVESNDAEVAAGYIKHFAQHPDQLTILSKRVRQRAMNFEWHRVAGRMNEIYQEMGWRR